LSANHQHNGPSNAQIRLNYCADIIEDLTDCKEKQEAELLRRENDWRRRHALSVEQRGHSYSGEVKKTKKHDMFYLENNMQCHEYILSLNHQW